ncbi:MAG: zinc-ribbon and DUF3426 domain-containing protein [Gammaproteobacteria bacterium]|nr:zinc-ribbon and DUF3426 domain-containing protein [Gammaproteobacteria bacterium]
MKKTLRTLCPACGTTFALTSAQLKARKGLVRCGHCSEVFRGDRHLVDTSPSEKKTQKRDTTKQTPKPKQKKALKQKESPTKRVKSARRGDDDPGSSLEEEFVSADVAQLLSGKRRWRVAPLVWLIGTAALSVVLVGQIAYFYPTELARYPQLAPVVTRVCASLGCEVQAKQDVGLIELLRTTVAPHPKQEQALRVRAALVNRAEFPQPFPLMEITLTNSAGEVVARRTFSPTEYLKSADVGDNMVPNVVVDSLLDISNPDPKPGGYEIRLLGR